MNMSIEYKYAREHVRTIDWSQALNGEDLSGDQPPIPFFETVIRYLGGLISAYDLSGDRLMLRRAEELANWILPSFETSHGFPVSRYLLGKNPAGAEVGMVSLAEIGSLTLEFTRLSQLTQKSHYYYYVQRIIKELEGPQWNTKNRLGTLFPTFIDPMNPKSMSGDYTFGGMADSYYEYLIKEFQLLGGHDTQYKRMYESAIESALDYLIKTIEIEGPGSKRVTVIGERFEKDYLPVLEHLTCFSGAMVGLGARLLGRIDDLTLAFSLTDSCVWAYESTKTGLGPEKLVMMRDDEDQSEFWEIVQHNGTSYRQLRTDGIPGAHVTEWSHRGRPETIESVFYMWRITGDRSWQDRGWRMFTSWVESCFVDFGFAGLHDVDSFTSSQSDKQESFVLAETLKYYYLLFEEPDFMSLDEHVFNTEAHPFYVGDDKNRVDQLGQTYEFEESEKKIDPSRDGMGTFLQAWASVALDKLSDSDMDLYKQIIGI